MKHHQDAGLHGLIAGHGELVLAIALTALILIAISRVRASSKVTLTEIAVAADAAFCAFWPGFHHAKAGPRIIVFLVLAALILVLRSMLRHFARGKAPAAAARPSGFSAAPRTAPRGRGRGR